MSQFILGIVIEIYGGRSIGLSELDSSCDTLSDRECRSLTLARRLAAIGIQPADRLAGRLRPVASLDPSDRHRNGSH